MTEDQKEALVLYKTVGLSGLSFHQIRILLNLAVELSDAPKPPQESED
jgi:hypothetical protein